MGKSRQNKGLILLIILQSAWIHLQAQEGNALQFMRGVSQSSWSNPAFQNQDERLIVGLPLLSGVTVNWSANFASDYIFSKHFTYSFNRFYHALGEPGIATPTATVPLLYLSQKKGKQNFTFSLSEKVVTTTDFDHEILNFIDLGLLPYYEKEAEFGPLSVQAYYYRELALGYSVEIWEGLNVGFRPKLLFARFYYDLPELHIKVNTGKQMDQLLVTPIGSYTLSAPVEITYDAEIEATLIRPNPKPADYFFNFHNLSPAIDIGLTWSIAKNTGIELSVLDLGYVGFRHNTYKIDFVAPLRYLSNELYQSNIPDNKQNYKEPKIALEEFSDRLPFIITAEANEERIIRRIPAKLLLSVKQRLNSRMEIGLTEQYTAFPGYPYNYLTGFYRSSVGSRWNLAATLSLLKPNKILPGFGASYTGRRAQYYLATNNITALVKPSSAKSLNLSFGMNFLFTTYQN